MIEIQHLMLSFGIVNLITVFYSIKGKDNIVDVFRRFIFTNSILAIVWAIFYILSN